MTSDYLQSDEAWWAGARDHGIYIGDIDYDVSAGVYAVALCLAIYDDEGGFSGVLKAVLNIRAITGILAQRAENHEEQRRNYDDLALLGTDGRQLFSTSGWIDGLSGVKPQEIFGDEAPGTLDQSTPGPGALNQAKTATWANTSDRLKRNGAGVWTGPATVFAFAQSASNGVIRSKPHWIVASQTPKRRAFAQITDHRRQMLLLGILMTLFVLGSVGGMAVRIRRRLHVVLNAIKRLGRGDFDVRIPNPGANEQGMVAKCFNEMASRLKGMEAARESMQSRLLDTSRRAGMAEVATGVLHNIGNILNGVNISTETVSRRARLMSVGHLEQAVDLIHGHRDDLGAFFAQDDTGKHLPGFLRQVAVSLDSEQSAIVTEIEKLKERVNHIRHVIDTQETHGNAVILTEATDLQDLIHAIIEIDACSLTNHQIKVACHFEGLTTLDTDQHLLTEILVGLLGNAKRALRNSDQPHKQIDISVKDQPLDGEPGLCLSVRDNGSGITKEHLPQVFQHGFTTYDDRHGFGLHRAANTAKMMSGKLVARSEGAGYGATFELVLPRVVSSKKAIAA